MNWKLLIPLPIAALWLGHPLHAPILKSPLASVVPIPQSDQERALQSYLMAYAYAEENPRAAWLFLRSAESSLKEGKDLYPELKQRMEELKARLIARKFPNLR